MTAPQMIFINLPVRDLDRAKAFFNAIRGQKMDKFTFVDYSEHAIHSGSDSKAVAYIHLRAMNGKDVFGVGISHNISLAPLRGILSAINRAKRMEII